MHAIFYILISSFIFSSCLANIPPNSLTEKKLQAIIQKQEKAITAFAKKTRNTQDFQQKDTENYIHAIAQEYESFLKDNPDCVEGYILYGKFLRQFNQDDAAFNIFLKANQINPNIAVVKQQLGNYLAETGQYTLALPYFTNAIALDPTQAIYHYQLGELLCQYKELFIKRGFFSIEALDEQLQASFLQAHKLDLLNQDLARRYAESFFDINHPSWEKALKAWEKLQPSAKDGFEKDLIHFNIARILIHLKHYEEARHYLNKIFDPSFEKNRRELLESIQSL